MDEIVHLPQKSLDVTDQFAAALIVPKNKFL